MRAYVVLAVIALSGCAGTSDREISLEGPKAGDVLFEQKRGKKLGYTEIFQSVVNSPSHWEEVGHFVFVYYRKHQVCQCSLSQVSISPKGRYLVFVAPDGPLSLFDSKTLISRPLTGTYVGYPQSVEWNFRKGLLRISVTQPSGEITVTPVEVNVALEAEA